MLKCLNTLKYTKSDEERPPIARSLATFIGKGKDTILRHSKEITLPTEGLLKLDTLLLKVFL